MNDRFDLAHDDRRFDRLVDGELSTAEYQSVLQSLDGEPESWRKLALAFLEAQAWEREFGRIRRAAEPGPAKSVVDDVAVVPHDGRSSQWLRWMALAASLLVMFGFGVAFDRELTGGWTPPQAPGPTLVNKLPTGVIGSFPQNSATHAAPGIHDPNQPYTNVGLILDGDGEEDTQVVVPLYAANDQNVDRMANCSDTQEFIEKLERMGVRVRREQQYLPFELENGQSAIVPVERVVIDPPRLRPF